MLMAAQLVAITMMMVLFMIGSISDTVSLDCLGVVKYPEPAGVILTVDDILTFPSWLSAIHSYLGKI